LTNTLRGLEGDGIVTLRLYASVPPRVEYLLTDHGRSLVETAKTDPDYWTERRSPTALVTPRASLFEIRACDKTIRSAVPPQKYLMLWLPHEFHFSARPSR
jgi:hypothetical protein